MCHVPACHSVGTASGSVTCVYQSSPVGRGGSELKARKSAPLPQRPLLVSEPKQHVSVRVSVRLKQPLLSVSVKRYIRKGVPLEHRARVWMGVSGAQAQMDQNPGYYQRLLQGERCDRLEEAIRTGELPGIVMLEQKRGTCCF